MIKNILKKSIIISFSLFVLTAHSQRMTNNEDLAVQCKFLAQEVSSLITSQINNTCVNKLITAAEGFEYAGDLILENSINSAKLELDESINDLQIAELISCNKYIQIVHYKVEAQKIKNSL